MVKKKWEIPALRKGQDFLLSARIIIGHRFSEVLGLVHMFRSTHEAEVLHQLRIAIRRLRYSLEAFLILFSQAETLAFLKLINRLQRVAGAARDYDVLTQELHALEKKAKEKVSEKIFTTVMKEKQRAYRTVIGQLTSFLGDPCLPAFQQIIGYDEILLEIQKAKKRRETGKKNIIRVVRQKS